MLNTNYNIPDVKRNTNFKLTFLYNVNVIVSFSNKLKELDKISFNSLGWNETKEIEGYMTFRKDDSVIALSNSLFLLSIPHKDYKNFENLIPILKHLEKYLDSIDIANVSILKENRYRINNLDDKDDDAIKNLILSLEAKNSTLGKLGGFVEFVKDNIIEAAVIKLNRDNNAALLQLLLLGNTSIIKDSVIDTLIEINDNLYSLWHWVVSDNVLKLMEEN